MKKLTFTLLSVLILTGTNIFAQQTKTVEKYGKTLNAGVGIGYGNYNGNNTPVLHADFEFDVLKNFTLAPFITYYSYQNYYYWGDNNKNYPFRNYYYRETVIPIGVKGSYYFDQFINAPKWDFYAAGSLGFVIRKTTWDSEYYGDQTVSHTTSPLYLDIHLGTEYHITKKIGAFVDLSTGISTLGLAVHL
jgi:hypothetical protein